MNVKTSSNAYKLSFHSGNNDGEFWEAFEFHYKQQGKTTSITFDMVLPNPPDITYPAKVIRNKLKEHINAERVKENVSNSNGLKLENDEVMSREKYIQTDGGNIVAKDGGKII